MEIWDGYREDGTLAGVDLVRGEAIPKGLKHAVAEVFVMHQDGTILLMQRDYHKPNYPGAFESGASGSVIKGESFLEGAKRELQEETGIVCSALKKIYEVQNDAAIYIGYVCVTDIAKNKIRLQEGETISYRWISKEDFLKFYKTKEYVPTLQKRVETFVENGFQ